MSQHFPPYVLRIIPARAEEPVTLATAMQALVLNARAPTALEIVGTAHERGFQVRTVNEAALTHLTTQLRARYPQLDCRQMLSPEEDPFHLGTGETLSVVELTLGAAVYFPLRQWSERDLRQKGADPVLGVLAALDAIPSPLRAVAQLALVPAAPTWSKQYQRKALEHALEPERQRQQPSHTGLLSLPLLCLSALALVLTLYTQQRLPAWADRDITQLLQGHVPSLSVGQQLLLVALTGVPLVLWWLVRRIWHGWLSPPLYDRKLVGAHTSQMAYRLRLRLYVIGPGTPWTWTRGMWIAWRLAARMGSLSYAAACKIMAWVWMKRTTSLSTVHCWKYRFRTRVGAWWRTHWQPLVRQVRDVSGWKRLLVVSGALGYLGRDGAHRFESGIEWVRLWSGRFWESIERL
ncbi:MAG: hypothetical protein J2P37_34775, partial [Ktedonobacteraceae bacterium]|nr:hypothetical protein [Ktedonobacteraceae bacterium]